MLRLATALLASTAVLLVAGVSSAGAAKCENCPQDEGGGVPAPAPPQPAPTVIAGTLQFRHPLDTKALNGLKPIRSAEVRVVREGLIQQIAATTSTGADGRFRVTVPHSPGARYHVEVLSRNAAADVLDETTAVPVTFDDVVRTQGGEVLTRTADFAGQTLEFSTDILDAVSARHFNIAEVLLRGRAYADAHRDPRETDAIGRVPVRLGTWPSPTSWYDPVGGGTIKLHSDRGFEDVAILHEYGHVLEDDIGAFPWVPSAHGSCISSDILGFWNNSPELAWMEGFADWFAQVVDPEPIGTPDTGTPSRNSLETPTDCGRAGGFNTDTFEPHVAGFLWDLFDRDGDRGPGTPDDDGFTRADDLVFQIMDRELDVPPGGGPWPQISTFRSAWYGRGLGWLDPLLSQNGIHTFDGSRPAPEPLPEQPPDPKVCSQKPYTPGC